MSNTEDTITIISGLGWPGCVVLVAFLVCATFFLVECGGQMNDNDIARYEIKHGKAE